MAWLTATEALRLLNVRPQTLYANVSRRRIRAKPDPKDPRRSLYHEVDVRKLSNKQGGRRKSAVVAATAMEWGDPVLSSSIATVSRGRLWYRGSDAVALSESAPLEEIASLLWGVEQVDLRFVYPARLRTRDGSDTARAHPLQRAFVALSLRAAVDAPSFGRALLALQEEAPGVLATLADAMLGQELTGERRAATRGRRAERPQREPHNRIHERIASAWGCLDAADLVRRALVLLADHELNASTFATRVAISTGAPLSAGVLSGLATLSGPLHGRAALGVREILMGARRSGARNIVREWLAQGRAIAGFGHPLYPAGDPRATALLAQVVLPQEYLDLCRVVEELIGERPSVDFALAVITDMYSLPSEAPLILFAIGRCVGWLAHALEQATTGHPIRPRARYVGPPVP